MIVCHTVLLPSQMENSITFIQEVWTSKIHSRIGEITRILLKLYFIIISRIQNQNFLPIEEPKFFPIDSSKRIVDIICYCLMPNHFHLLVKQLQDGGISELMRKLLLSSTKYRNTKYNHQGSLFQVPFKAVHIETDEQLLHVSRYIHLNPLVSLLVKDLKFYPWSSYLDYIGMQDNPAVKKDEILIFFKSPKDYEKFILDQADYGMALEKIKHLIIDE